ncbi:MotA/TolQ/ExbB proton channel family protein [Marinifilum caeruleilacunae]|uniref:MotA/TolQ/ExbB proton channel family protein n=1 Tax=Marinifilum caeruleilacunae TaxID=2499076 RepID=A0ABX1WQG4_9BACT|nr:MotA/TolQ/ExbB proton channel family protein [Marinifilum caeruleilacunae]NOU58334.1 MotA/TolQ/ExbB proton channel family protein [Marinifilum caeruleilacunae]
MDQITNLLYWISTGLLIPVIVLLLIFFLRALLLVGLFYGMYIQKLKFNKSFKENINQLNEENVDKLLESLNGNNKLLLSTYLGKLINSMPKDIYYDKILNDFEMACQKDLSSSQTLTKLGPILGLMGTLIPMGPALVGLASGDIESMALNMQVAFATTVIGLLTGAVGFVVMQVKRRWYASDISDMEFVVELLKLSKKKHEEIAQFS